MLRSFPVSAVLALALSCVAAVGFAGSLEPNLKLLSDSAAGASLPIEVRSQSSGGHLQGTVVSEVDLAFPVVADALARVSSWCELLPLHLNVKACVHGRTASGESLVIFIGRKFYREPDDAYRLEFDFSVRSSSTRLELVLHSEGGALGARDCTLELSAEPRGDRTRLQLDFSQQYGVLARVGLASYLRTLGRSKVGFSQERNPRGRLVPVGGASGMIERNAVRYHLAVQAHLETLEVDSSFRNERAAARWFELTQAWPAQLFELERDVYLDNKRRELANQLRLQAAATRSEADRALAARAGELD